MNRGTNLFVIDTLNIQFINLRVFLLVVNVILDNCVICSLILFFDFLIIFNLCLNLVVYKMSSSFTNSISNTHKNTQNYYSIIRLIILFLKYYIYIILNQFIFRFLLI